MLHAPEEGQIAPHENSLWQKFSQSQEDQSFYDTWLELASSQINRAVRAVLVLGEPDSGAYRAVAFWPEGQGGSSALGQLAEQSLATKQGMAGQIDETASRFGVALPLVFDEHLYGVVAVEIGHASSTQFDQSLRQLRWSSGWLEARLVRKQSDQEVQLNKRLVTALELIVSILELPDYDASVKALVTELAQKLQCDRVSIGFKTRSGIQVEAISHSVELEKQMNVVQAIGQAMDEAFDQCQSLSYPAEPENNAVLRQHEALAQQFGSGAILTIPLYVQGEAKGALLFERPANAPFDGHEIELCRSIATVVAPILNEKQLNARGLFSRLSDAMSSGLSKLLGPEYYLRKAIALLVTLSLISLFLVDGQYRVTTDTVLEGKIQRSIVTPFDGYIAQAEARAGDLVKQGQLLAQLEDRDLQLERIKWLSQRGQLNKEYDEGMALRDRARVSIIAAQIAQSNAQLNLVNEKLTRTQVTAPFDGLIIRGDLNQSLGGSVARGDLLFVIAPLSDYRIILRVNERSIQQLEKGQTGTLVLSSLPDERFEFVVERITPISTAEEGENYFRVEAGLDQHAIQLRPGMEGVAKIDIGERSLAWIWSHEIIDWLQLWLWRWLP